MTDHPVKRRKKLIEVSIPLEAINSGAASEQGKRHQNPSTLHLWWSRKPMGTARAILFCQCVDDPGSVPEEYPTEGEQENERLRLHAIAAGLAQWESYSNASLLSMARAEMISTWKRCCNDNSKHPEANKLFNPDLIPRFCDPFSGGGVIPLEAQRMGLTSLALDLNPVSVLINKCLIDFPTRFSGMQPVNPAAGLSELSIASQRNGSKGLHEDCLFYGMALGELVESKIRNLYPEVVITNEMTTERPDLRDLVGQSLKVFTWIWTRTVPSPNPLYKSTKVPLASKFWLSTKNGSEAYVEPIIEADKYCFKVRKGKPKDLARVKKGTSISRGNFRCILSGDPIGYKYIDNEASLGNVGYRLMAIVLIGPKGKIYIDPDAEHEKLALTAVPAWKPSEPSRGTWASNAQGRRYGCQVFGDYFLPRQLCTLNAFCDNLEAIRQRVRGDAEKAGLDSEPISIEAGGRGAQAYTEAITIYLSLAIDRFADYWTSFGRWQPANQQLSNTFSVQGIAMAWDFPEANPLSGKGGSFKNLLEWTLQSLPTLGQGTPGNGEQADAGTLRLPDKVIVSTDPPYYDNVGYSDLSDFFYCWLKKNLKHLYPSLFGTITTPKFNEIFACSTRHGGRDEAESFFLSAMTKAMTKLTEIIHPCYPATIYYAFKQSEAKNSGGVYSTGWETFLGAIVNAGMTINSTWPLRTEMANRMASIDSNSLSASILLVCEARSVAPVAVSRADFRRRLRARLAEAMKLFKRAGILPVDIAQSVIGTGFSLYSGAEQVINPDDSPMSVRDALIEINLALDTYLGEDEADLDNETRLALTFFESYGYEERPYGDAEGLAIARNLSVDGVAEAGILSSVAGKVRLYQRNQLPDDWDPTTDRRLCVWEATQHLIKRLEASGEGSAAELLLQLKNISGHGDLAANCRALAYRLYNHCEKKKQAEEARAYNGLVIAWPELERLASASSTSSSAPRQTTLI